MKHARVSCDCDGLAMVGSYETNGDWLVLHSPLGESRVRLGLANPRKLAARLLKNLCTKAAADAPPNAVPACGPTCAPDAAQPAVDAQRDKVVEMAIDDPARAKEERLLDQMVEAARGPEPVVLLEEARRDCETPETAGAAAVLPISPRR